MLNIGTFRSRACNGVSCCAFVTAAASSPFALGLPRAATAASENNNPVRSVMMVWLWGGPSHLDTFDPKPDATDDYRGPFQTIATKTSGARFTELVPKLAARSDKFAVVRGTKLATGHDMLPLTGGRRRGKEVDPNFGSIVARRRRAQGLPSFISVAPRTTLGHGFRSTAVPGFGGGRFGSAHNPFIVRCAPTGETDIEGLKLLDGLSLERLADRRSLASEMSRVRRGLDALPVDQWNQQVQGAYKLLTTAEGVQAFDLSRESQQTRAAYGRTSFGQSLLLGRRLVEAGVPYVHVNWSLGVDGLEEGSSMGWDTHRNGFGQLLNYHCPIFDRTFSALLDDLSQRGLLDSTLIVATGEMGRTPKINKTGGRDHWPTCSTLWAGGGVRGGRIVGATDARGGEPITKPITALDIGTTIAERAGVNAQARAEMRVLNGGEVIRELF